MKKTKSELIEEFIRHAIIQGECTLSGDYRTGNKSSDKLFKIKSIMQNDRQLGESMLDELLERSEVNVLLWASGIAVDMDYKKEKATEILKKIATMPGIGLISFNAQQSLKIRLNIIID